MTSLPNFDKRGIPVEVGTTVIYVQDGLASNVKVTEGTVIEILEDQFLIRRGRQWRGSRKDSYCTDRPVAILKHKCWVVPNA